jgi:hypothetical protein
MPIMASQGRSDARGTAQLLASMALDCIQNPELAREESVALNNAYRLLESYRTNPLFGFEAATHASAHTSLQRLTLKRPLERHVKEVRDALEEARRLVFGDRDRDESLLLVESVLRSVAYPSDKSNLSPGDLTAASKFFQILVGRLQNDEAG